MTIMTPIEGITAPRIPADPAAPIIETFLPYDETPLLSSRRADGWSAANQRLFLEAVAEGYGVEQATMRVGLSAASAYAFRRTAKGAAFALGWRAANLVARDAIAETLLVRALEGQVSTITRANGDVVTRHHHDNGLCMRLLARLDRQLEAAPDADTKAARLVAQEFDAYLDLVAKDEGPARAGLFLARAAMGAAELDPGSSPGRPGRSPQSHTLRGAPAGPAAPSDARGFTPLAAPGIVTMLAPIYALAAADRFARTGVATAAEVDVSDLDLAARHDWTADQWTRAEAAGLVALAPANTIPEPQHSQHSAEPTRPTTRLDRGVGGEIIDDRLPFPDDDDLDAPVWWDHELGEWRTHFPPPADFDGDEREELGHPDYDRNLTDEEYALMGGDPTRYDAAELAEQATERDVYFAALAVPSAPSDPTPAQDIPPAAAAAEDSTDPAVATPPVASTDPAPIVLTYGKSKRKSGTPAAKRGSLEDAAPAAGEPT